MTAKEAAEQAHELGRFLKKELPGQSSFLMMLTDLSEVLEHMALGEQESAKSAEELILLGNIKTRELRLVDSRDWLKYGVEWIDDAMEVSAGDRKEVKRRDREK